MKTNATCDSVAEIHFGGEVYTVSYTLNGYCSFDPGKLSGPPEDCYPPESESEVREVLITHVLLDDRTITPTPEFRAILLEELAKLPLDDYLYEAWAATDAGGDEGPPGDEE